jgi:TRAP-type C4-dicarboxylate transport system substrate-binding protein
VTRAWRALVSAALIVAAAGACAEGRFDQSGRQVTSPPRVLRLVVPTFRGSADADVAVAIADAAAEGGALFDVRIEYLSTDLEPGVHDDDAIGAVRSGAADLALVSARVWADAGATSLRPLELPGVVTSDRQADRVVRSSVVATLVRDVGDLGVTALALFPMGNRLLWVQRNDPIVEAADLAGAEVLSVRSTEADAVLERLGATPVQMVGLELFQTISNRTTDALTSTAVDLMRARSTLSGDPRSVLVDLPLSYRFLVLTIAAPLMNSLSEPERSALGDAVAVALDTVLVERTREVEALATYCTLGVNLSRAGASLHAALAQAATEATARVVEDLGGSDLIDRLRVAAGPADEPAASCPP